MKTKAGKIIREILLTVVMAIVVMTGYNLYLQKDMPTGPAPQIVSEQVNGTPVDLHALSRNQPVLVYFWASWCTVCKWVSPAISDLSEGYPVISVALASGDDERVRRYLQAKSLGFPAVNDEEGSISRDWAVSVTPSLFIVKDGEIRSVTTGYTTRVGLLLRLWWFSR
ncbi:MAG: protein disulfide oxidoreductase [Endozoicomonas sp.]